MLFRSLATAVLFLFLLPTLGAAQGIVPRAKVPFNPDIEKGKLPGGVTYYILKNAKPEGRVDLVMTVNAGAVLEDEDQNGLAHFCEHMAFNGTKNFPKLELVSFLESTGIRFGADLNAYTNQDETVYMLTMPKVDDKTVANGIRVLSDWASQVTYNDKDIEEERGVVLEEWRLGKGAEDRISKAHAPYLYHGSKYATHDVIGDTAVLKGAPGDALRRFYKKWYRPGNISLIIVGDVDPDDIASLLEENFTVEGPAEPNRPDIVLPAHDETLISVASDAELTGARVEMYVKRPADTVRTYADYRAMIVRNLANQMVQARLSELSLKAQPPIAGAQVADFHLTRQTSIFYAAASASDKNVLKAFNALLTEIERVHRHGFMPSELERAKAEIMSRMESYYNERNSTESQQFAFELVRHVLTAESVPGIEHEVEIYRHFIPQITPEECAAALKAMLTPENRVITISVPEGNGYVKPTEKQVRGLMDAVMAKEIAAYVDDAPTEPLMAEPPTAGHIVKREAVPEIGGERLTLSNGATVYLKKTDFKADEILMDARAFGGESVGSVKDRITLNLATDIVDASGIAQFSTPDLMKMLRGKNLAVSPYIGMETKGLRGSTTPKDMQTFFELLHLYFTKPRLDAEGYSSWKTKMQAQLENRDKSPEAALFDTLGMVMSSHSPWVVVMTPKLLDDIDTALALDFFKESFSGPQNFTFTFVGNFDQTAMDDFLKTYVASIPATDEKSMWKDVGMRIPKGRIQETVYKGEDQKSWVVMVLSGDAKYTHKNRYDLAALGEVMTIRLREKLREEKSGVYFVAVQPSIERIPTEHYSLAVYFTCSPDRVEELSGDVKTEIEYMLNNKVDDSYIQKVKEIQTKEREKALKENNFWLGSIMQLVINNEPFSVIEQRQQLIDGLTSDQVHQAAKAYLKTDNVATVILKPLSALQSR